mgnify:CR=1 FL=1
MVKHISLTLLVTLMCCLWAGSSYADKGESKAKEDAIVNTLFYTTCPDCQGKGGDVVLFLPVICTRCEGSGRVISWMKVIQVVFVGGALFYTFGLIFRD